MAKTVSRISAEHYTWGEGCDGWHLVKEPTLSVIEERMPPGTAEVPHLHHKAQQFFYVLSGEAVIEIAGRQVQLNSGEGVQVNPGTPHCFKNNSQAPVHFIVTSVPPSHGDRVVI